MKKQKKKNEKKVKAKIDLRIKLKKKSLPFGFIGLVTLFQCKSQYLRRKDKRYHFLFVLNLKMSCLYFTSHGQISLPIQQQRRSAKQF